MKNIAIDFDRSRTGRGVRQKAQAGQPFAAKLQAPFAILGIRTRGAKLVGIEYLPTGERELAPTDAVAERTCRQL